jgi:AraC-like DNA-binding protein
VAADLHFRGADTFCRAFKSHYGQRPDGFRHSRQNVQSSKSKQVEPIGCRRIDSTP